MVQKLIKEEYDLDQSIEAVQLYGTLDKAMDYLASKDSESGDEQVVKPATSLELTSDERYAKSSVHAVSHCLHFWLYGSIIGGT